MTSTQKSENTEQFWFNHIKQWKVSGLSQNSYCKEHDLKPHNLSYHKCKQARNQDNTQLSTPISTGFIELAVSPTLTLPEPLILHFCDGVQLTGLAENNLELVKQLAEVLR